MEHLELCLCVNLTEVKISTRMDYPAQKYFDNLRNVVIGDCRSLSNVTWLIYAPKLETLELRNCVSLREIIEYKLGRKATFSSLKVLRLVRLPLLRRIYWHVVLSFPSLKKMEVLKCPHLQEQPFAFYGAKNCLIHGHKMWWDSLRWEDEEVKASF